MPGAKWTGLRQLLNSWDGWKAYDYIWLPDDDILASQDTINRMFDAARALRFQLCAPALHEDSYFAHYSTMQNRSFFARRTSFVEIMMPCFSREALVQLLPTLDQSTTGWGWGLDSLWPKLLEYKGLGIIDDVPVVHTRPVGQFRDSDLGGRVTEESERIHRDGRCQQRTVTFSGIGADMQHLSLSPDELLVQLIQGWQHLFARDPRILRWIVEHQQPFFEWPPYVVDGSPTGLRAG